MKKILSLKALKNMGKEEQYSEILGSLDRLRDYYFRFCISNADKKNEFFALLDNYKLVARHFKKFVKEDENPFPDGFNFIISELITSRIELETEVREIYTDVLAKLVKASSKKLIKKLEIPKDAAIELAAILPGAAVNQYNAWIFVHTLNRRLMTFQHVYFPTIKEDTEETKSTEGQTKERFNFADVKLVKKIFKLVFGDDPKIWTTVIANIMLDKAEITKNYNETQMNMWSTITTFIMKTLEGLKKDHIAEIIKQIGKRRAQDESRGRDCQRRVVLSNIIDEDYPNIYYVLHPKEAKAAKKDKKKDKKKKSKKK